MNELSTHDITLVRAVLTDLEAANVRCWLFGGWAEELRALRTPGPHKDIDLLYPTAAFAAVDAYLSGPGRSAGDLEIHGKRFVHKRAFERAGVMVELFGVRTDNAGWHTLIHGKDRFDWPGDVFDDEVAELRVASTAALRAYRAYCSARCRG